MANFILFTEYPEEALKKLKARKLKAKGEEALKKLKAKKLKAKGEEGIFSKCP